MIIFVSEKQVRTNLKKFQVHSFDKEVLEKVNESMLHFTHNLLEKVIKKNKDLKKIEELHLQKALQGGRVLFPSEYYGVATNHYVDAPQGHHDMTPTDAVVRPAMEIRGPWEGGASTPLFVVSERAMKAAVSEALVRLNVDVSVKGSVVQELKRKFEKEMTALLRTVQKKNGSEHLRGEVLTEVLRMKKYKNLQK